MTLRQLVEDMLALYVLATKVSDDWVTQSLPKHTVVLL